eukprot:scaffold3536_cov146-Isochrysis_galbana.AAC.3
MGAARPGRRRGRRLDRTSAAVPLVDSARCWLDRWHALCPPAPTTPCCAMCRAAAPVSTPVGTQAAAASSALPGVRKMANGRGTGPSTPCGGRVASDQASLAPALGRKRLLAALLMSKRDPCAQQHLPPATRRGSDRFLFHYCTRAPGRTAGSLQQWLPAEKCPRPACAHPTCQSQFGASPRQSEAIG